MPVTVIELLLVLLVTFNADGLLAKLAANVWLGEAVGVEAKDPFVELGPLLLALVISTTVIATWTNALDSSTSAEQHSMFWKKEDLIRTGFCRISRRIHEDILKKRI